MSRSVMPLGICAFILVLTLALAACSPVTILNALSGSPGSIVANVPYGDDAQQKLDIYRPAGIVSPPVVVFFYGGSWSSGSRAEYKFVGNALASRGIMAVIADYRLYPQVSYPGFIEDSAQAVAWTRRHIGTYGGDPRRLFVMGHSAGAYNAAMVALDPRWLAEFHASPAILSGWIGIAGPYDFLPIVDKDVKPVFHFPDTPADSQPIAHVTSAAPPTLLLSGTSDTTVDPVRNTGELTTALQAAHADVHAISYKGVGHAALAGAFGHPLRWMAPVLDDVTKFIKETPPAGVPAQAKNNR